MQSCAHYVTFFQSFVHLMRSAYEWIRIFRNDWFNRQSYVPLFVVLRLHHNTIIVSLLLLLFSSFCFLPTNRKQNHFVRCWMIEPLLPERASKRILHILLGSSSFTSPTKYVYIQNSNLETCGYIDNVRWNIMKKENDNHRIVQYPSNSVR